MSDVLLMHVSVAFLFLALIVVIALRDNPKVQLLTLDALSLVLIGLPRSSSTITPCPTLSSSLSYQSLWFTPSP